MIKIISTLAVCATILAISPVTAYAQEEASATETDKIETAVAFAKKLNDDATVALTSEKSESEQLADFQTILGEALALETISKFMIGNSRKSMSEEQLDRYNAVFPKYLTRIYAEQFADIVGRPLDIIDSIVTDRGDVIVRSQFTRKEGAPIMVDWRIRTLRRSGEQKAIDIIVSGVSIMLVKREEISAFIEQNGVDALLDRLEIEAAG